jgi:pyocin large subunit-like protein
MIDLAFANQIPARRAIEDALLQLGRAHSQSEAVAELNRTAVKSWLARAREAGIAVADIARLTGYSKQTLHTWMRERMVPIPAVHLGLSGPAPETLEEAVLRTIGEEPGRAWSGREARAAIPEGWPTGTIYEVTMALDLLARSGQIWPNEDGGFQIHDPDPDPHA